MALFCLLLVITAFVQPPWAVAPVTGNDGSAVPKPQINGHMPVNSAPFAGSMNMGGSNVGIDFSGDGKRLYDPSTGAMVSGYFDNINNNFNNQRPITYPPAHGQTYAPAYGQTYEPAHGAASIINYEDLEEEEDEEQYHDEDAEYAEALAELERAEAYAAQMAAKCNQKYIKNNTRLRNKCFAERDQANAARDAAKENLETIKERVESAAPAENGSEDADNEYAAAKEKMDKAEKYASEMSAKCLEPNIQRNIRVRDDCYAKRNQAQRDRDAARDEFYAIRDRLQYGAAASNAYIPPFIGPAFTGPAFTGPAFTGPAFTGPPFTGPPFTGPPFTGPPFTGPTFTGPAFTGPTYTGPTFAGPAFTAPFFTPNPDTSNMNNNNVVTNGGPHYTVRLTNTMNGETCENKIKITRSTDGGEIEEFTLPCLGQSIGSINDGEEVLIGGPDDKFCAFTMTKIPESLIVIKDGKCMKRTYSDSTVFVSTFKESDCKYIKDRIKTIEEKVKSRVFNSRLGKTKLNADIDSLEEELAKKLNEITPISTITYTKPSKQTGPGTPNQTSSGIIPPGSTEGTEGNSLETNNGIGGSVIFGTDNMFNVGNNENQILSGNVIISGGFIGSRSFDMTIQSSESIVGIRQYRGKGGECEEEIMVVWLNKPTGKTIYAKCEYGVSRRTIVRANLILIGSPNEKFCAFTTNKNEIYYLDNGKWKKSDFSGDNKNDKELTSSEVSRIKERINKWEEFFVKNKKEIERIKHLKNVKKENRNISKEQIKALRNKERETHRGIIDNIKQLRNEERNKHRNEKQNIKNTRRKEGWTPERVDKLEAEEDRRHNIEDARLDQMINDEDVRHDNEDKRYDALLNEEDRKYDEEIRKLDALRDKEDLRAFREFKQMISQGL